MTHLKISNQKTIVFVIAIINKPLVQSVASVVCNRPPPSRETWTTCRWEILLNYFGRMFIQNEHGFIMHLCLFTSSVPFFMFPSRLVRSCSGILDVVIINIEEEGGWWWDWRLQLKWWGSRWWEWRLQEDHLNEKFFYEIFGHRVDVARPVYLPASKKRWAWLLSGLPAFLFCF